MYAAIAIRANCLFSHSKYLDSSLLVFSLCIEYIIKHYSNNIRSNLQMEPEISNSSFFIAEQLYQPLFFLSSAE